MVEIKDFFRDFLRGYIAWKDRDSYERNIALVVWNVFDEALTATTAVARNRLIGEEVTKLLDSETKNQPLIFDENELTVASANQNQDVDHVGLKIKTLTLWSFRWSHTPFKIDFSKEVTLLYWENGTGKTTIMEALETGLTGSIFLSKERGFDMSEYCSNDITGDFEMPILESYDGSVILPEGSREFNFIERARIDRFATISVDGGKTNKDREMLAGLFWVDHVRRFVTAFWNDISSQLLAGNEFGDSDKQLLKNLEETERELIPLKERVWDLSPEQVLQKLPSDTKLFGEIETEEAKLHDKNGEIRQKLNAERRQHSFFDTVKAVDLRYAGLCATALVLAWLIPLEWMRYSVFALGIFAGAIYIIYHHKKLKQCHDLSQERDVERLQKEQRESEDNLKKTQEQKRVLKILIENEQKYVDYNKRFDPERFAELKERRSSTDRKKEKIDGYIGAYKDFRNQLERTQEKQIESLTRGLTEDIVEIYNAIQFREKHKIKSISFPNQNNSRIQIEYIVQPGRSICASKNMSDGTLRILAFAILMAKVRSLHWTCVIIDDITGAIDSNHRSVLADFLVKESSQKQIIISTHSESFRNEVQASISSYGKKKCKAYTLICHEDSGIQVEHQDYAGLIEKAKFCCWKSEYRDAGKYIRECLDMLLHKAWKKAGVTLSFSLRNNEINLYAIFNAVKTAAENGVLFSGDCDTNIADCLSKFGPLASWQQMNKSNHYNDPVDDPDPSRTLEQISALEKFQEVFSPRKTLLVANSVESV